MQATATALQDLAQDPAFQYMLASAEAPASAPYMLSLLGSAAADLCGALHTASGHVAWALLHALGASVSAGGLLWATWRGGAASSHAVRGICWASAFAPVVPALERLFAAEDAAALAGAGAADRRDRCRRARTHGALPRHNFARQLLRCGGDRYASAAAH